MLKAIEFPWKIAQIVLQHHERVNGSGYPKGLTEPEILVESKILAVADVIEAMCFQRPYRPARGMEQALEEIMNNRGRLYDPGVVDVCVSLFKENKFRFA
jgi:HD-GYP domain-containing protein (c-di-GMP phosphodiesterase class II)